MKIVSIIFPLFIALATSAQSQRSVTPYLLDWSPKSGHITITGRSASGRNKQQVIDAQDIDSKSLARVLEAPANARALLYIHCWLGETRFFHRCSIDWLTDALQTSADTTPVILLALRWPSGKRSYRHSANHAGAKGANAAP